MLLLTFVENTFKYATMNSKGELFIDISSILTNGNRLSLQVKKSHASKPKIQTDMKGIGLANIQKRLELLYPKKYIFNINESND